MMSSMCRIPHSVQITSDASGGWECGAYSSFNQWLQAQWLKCCSSVHITVKELVPIVVACALWGDQWRAATVLCRCDNVAVVSTESSKDALVMHLMRILFITAVSPTGASRSLTAHLHPPKLWQILVLNQPDWTLRSWRSQFSYIFQRG